jgi:hypothetical protein
VIISYDPGLKLPGWRAWTALGDLTGEGEAEVDRGFASRTRLERTINVQANRARMQFRKAIVGSSLYTSKPN